MTTLYLDIETYSPVPIKHGVYRYAEEAEILLSTYAIDDGPVKVIDHTDLKGHGWLIGGMNAWADMVDVLVAADEVVAHNSMFDRAVLAAHGMFIELHKWRDTMVQAMTHSLPGGLEKLCAILQVPLDQRKMADGKALIQLFCKPRPKNSELRRATRETHPEQWKQFIEYAGLDVEAMRACHKRLPTWNYSGAELELWHLDQRINDRGVAVDVDMAAAAIRTAERVQRGLAARATDLTGGEVASTTQRDALLAHILDAHGVDLPDMKGDTIERRLNDPDLPWEVRELLGNRLEASRASVAKYKAMLRSVSKDGRIRGTLQFAGALRTGRWAGRLIQPQNFKRTPEYLTGKGAEGDAKVAFAAEAIAADAADLFYDKPLEVLASGVPWAIVAPKGKKLVCPDLSNIEGRVLAWLAGEEWKLAAFRHYDENPKDKTRDLYIIGYAKSFGESIADVVADYEAGGQKRQVGKVQELMLGYQGAVGAYVTGAATYRLDLNTLVPALATVPAWAREKAADFWTRAEGDGRTFDLKRDVYTVCHAFTSMWRAANPKTVQFWWDLFDAATCAIASPGQEFPVGRVTFRRDANWMRIRLPSGRYLCYPNPKIDPLSYKGVNQYTRKWQTILTYGGKLAENITQAVACDVLKAAMPNAEAEGYEIVFHVHDELVAEVPDTDEFSADELGEILATNPSWADGLPLAVGGYETYRYRKD
jgi:DNA polymerase bacteriophage-type